MSDDSDVIVNLKPEVKDFIVLGGGAGVRFGEIGVDKGMSKFDLELYNNFNKEEKEMKAVTVGALLYEDGIMAGTVNCITDTHMAVDIRFGPEEGEYVEWSIHGDGSFGLDCEIAFNGIEEFESYVRLVKHCISIFNQHMESVQ